MSHGRIARVVFAVLTAIAPLTGLPALASRVSPPVELSAPLSERSDPLVWRDQAQDVGLLALLATDVGDAGEGSPVAQSFGDSLPTVDLVATAITCFATPNDGATIYSSTTASAVRQALGVASPGATVKVAGYCPGVSNQGGTSQVALITQTLTLAGGFTPTNWTTAYPIIQPATLDALTAGRGIVVAAPSTIQGLVIAKGSVSGFVTGGGGLYAAQPVTLSDIIVVSSTAAGPYSPYGLGGGALLNAGASVSGSTFAGNNAREGGGAYILSYANVTGSSFGSNIAQDHGGGVFISGTASVSDSTIASNYVIAGGGGAWFEGKSTVTRSSFVSNSAGACGGALFVADTSVLESIFASNTINELSGGGACFDHAATVSGSTFSGNRASNGSYAGGAEFYGEANVASTKFIDNVTDAGGGGAVFWARASVSGSTFGGNINLSGPSGGASFQATAIVEGSTFISNTTTDWAGGADFHSFASVTGSTFTSNTAGSYGGGAHFWANASVTGTTFARNTAGSFGGGASFYSGSSVVVNSLFAHNAAPRGVAVSAYNTATLSMIHATLADSVSKGNSAIYINSSGAVRLTNTLMSNHLFGIEQWNGAVYEDYSLFSGVITPTRGNVSRGGHSITGTAGFVNPAANDYRLGPGSSAINAGVNAGIAMDFEGTPRPTGAGFDIGYDEWVPNACFATPDAGTTVYSSTNGAALRQALGAASLGGTVKVAGFCAGVASQGGSNQVALITQTLTVAGGYTPTNWTSAFPITQPTTLDALSSGRGISVNAPATLQGLIIANGAISGDGGGLYAVQPVTLSGVTVISSSASGSFMAARGGGAFFLDIVSVTGSTFARNSSSTGGGAFFISAASVSGCTFASNTAGDYGGGAYISATANVTGSTFATNVAYIGGGAYFLANANVTASTFASNTAFYGGGAVLGAAATVAASTFASNSAYDSGGAAFEATATVVASTFADNTANWDGGGVQFYSGTGVVVNTLFARNAAPTGAAVIANYTASLNLIHVTIAYSGTNTNAAIYVATTGTVRLTNTLISNHTVGIESIGGSVSEDYSLFSGVSAPYSGTITSGGHSITGTAAFVNPAADDYHLAPGSSAINAGVNAGIATDFEGTPRPIDGGFDIGYDEYIPPQAWLPMLRR